MTRSRRRRRPQEGTVSHRDMRDGIVQVYCTSRRATATARDMVTAAGRPAPGARRGPAPPPAASLHAPHRKRHASYPLAVSLSSLASQPRRASSHLPDKYTGGKQPGSPRFPFTRSTHARSLASQGQRRQDGERRRGRGSSPRLTSPSSPLSAASVPPSPVQVVPLRFLLFCLLVCI
jgi:hypothetical protein